MHPQAPHHLHDHRAGRLSRREFLTRVTALGVTAPAAYALIGLDAPAAAQTVPVSGGVMRMQMPTLPLCDPRLADWPEIGNVLRGWLEPLVEYEPDGTFTGRLLDRWEVADDARSLRLHLRPNIHWWNGDALTAEHVAFNLRRWLEPVPRNAMATVMDALRDGEVVVEDALTLHLTLGYPDATLIAGFSEYAALIVHPSYDGADPAVGPLGSGPFRPVLNEVGKLQVLERTDWWGTPVFGGPYLDRIEYVDLGTDPALAVAAAKDGLIDAVDQSVRDFAPALVGLGWVGTHTRSASTLTVRFNQRDPLFADVRVRRAVQLAVDNAVVLDIGIGGAGEIGENHHVSPLHPDYASIGPAVPDAAAALGLLTETGMEEQVFTLVSLDDAWQALSCDVVAAQMHDAGFKTERRILPGADYWPTWMDHAFSATVWNMRPLGVQVLRLAYRSDAPWNETGFANDDFDAALDRALAIVDAAERQRVMAELETILRDQAVIIQPYWRHLSRHTIPAARGMDVMPTLVHRHHMWWIAR